jgi:DNA-binding transcriptional LysR family regulator
MGRSYRYKDIQLVQLRSFCLAASRGNFTAAARSLGLSLSTVWEQVRALEYKLGAPLLRQRGRVAELTQEGRLLLELVQPYVTGLDSLERLFEARRAELPQQLTVASSQYLLHHHLARPIQEFTATHPAVHLNVQLPEAQAITPMVERGEVDLAVFPFHREERRNLVLEYEDLFDLPFLLLAPTRHPLTRKKRISLQDVVPYPVILPTKETYSRRVIDRILQSRGVAERLRVVLETAVHDTIQKYVALGVGVALVHMSLDAELSGSGLHLRVLDSGLESLPVALILRRHAHLPDPVQEFRRMVRHALSSQDRPS